MNRGDSAAAGELLSTLTSLAEFKKLPVEALPSLAAEIRDFLVDRVSRTGGHIGPNLGVVELTMALHRVFDSPHDRIVFDTGHQSYVHKILTGRAERFDKMRKRGGLTGYPSQSESRHDLVENCHASTALSYADGLAKATVVRGDNRHVVAIVGDGALTGGMCWEALNNIAARKDLPLVIVVNDNGRSYAPTIGGLANHLATLRLNPSYEKMLDTVKDALGRTPVVGQPLFEAMHAVKRGIKDAVAPQAMFEDLGIKYFGPVDGHDLDAMTSALERAKGFGGPVIVHAITQKGKGYQPAEDEPDDQMHQSNAFDPDTGQALPGGGGVKWTSVFADELVAVADERPDVVGITAAMAKSTGIAKLADKHPDRAFDVGIAEQHAVTSAAGMALAGLHPVVAVYSTFLNRAFDQVALDVAMHKLPVTFVLDRSGITGPDGPSHYGIWDMSVFRAIPGLRIAAPRDAETLREEFREALDVNDAPTIVRIPTGTISAELPAIENVDGVDVMARGETKDVLLVACGSFVGSALDAAARVTEHGFGVTVVDPRWVAPVPRALTSMAAEHRLVVTVEDGLRTGGFGDALAKSLRDAEVDTPLRDLGVAAGWHEHGTRDELLADLGLTTQDLSRAITETILKIAEADAEPLRVDG
ncbi:1-deoxy-D-xylulose-5-phosphate synthase [Stackebrandtia nassauensis]|uniref:1-deoxy-D-xylulose-5-phosphate synthase n=1 Tax=Stackebrandtia nassauensis (strain DSM 44728 / CIP 108903 / NRRL B-16338 / NBRC 102104 / LLR-40K-21) TaxID=446470 RepID=D3Q5B9_STANL|nr:1-deoxy-D-xylulose-5-phosphate synthase [Stackebrandtia nassauensis]ADD44168.1 deoxyxylulose-5-phosphate synthase [Stackebrandtia nassauensis DSM 44728]